MRQGDIYLLRARRSPKPSDVLVEAALEWRSPSTLKMALFPVVFRRIYRAAQAQYTASYIVPAALTAPTLLLLPSGLRVHVALNVASAALLSIPKPPRLKHLLPPTWSLNVFGNAVLIWLFVRDGGHVQPSYEAAIVHVRSSN